MDLINACKYGNEEKEIRQLIENGTDVNMKIEYSDTPLTILCKNKMNLKNQILIKRNLKKNQNKNKCQ